jgi:hypothetical protein
MVRALSHVLFFFFNPGPVWRVPIPNRYTAKAKLCFCKNNKRRIIITWRNLRALGIEAQALKQLQSDKYEWLQRGGIQVSDLIDMVVFPVNPLTDFGVDLAELWQLRCSTHARDKLLLQRAQRV